MPGGQSTHGAEQASLAPFDRKRIEKQSGRDLAVKLAVQPWQCGQGAHLGREGEPVCRSGVEQWFDAKAVARKEQVAAGAVVNGNRPHAVEARQHGRSPMSPGFENDLGVAVAAKYAAELLKLLAQLYEVVDLAVVDDGETALAALHRLVATVGRVDDREAAMHEPDRVVCADPDAFAVGASMR